MNESLQSVLIKSLSYVGRYVVCKVLYCVNFGCGSLSFYTIPAHPLRDFLTTTRNSALQSLVFPCYCSFLSFAVNSVPAGRSFILGRKQAKRQIKQYIGSSKKPIPLIFLGLKSCKRGKIDRPPWGLNLITLACLPATLPLFQLSTIYYCIQCIVQSLLDSLKPFPTYVIVEQIELYSMTILRLTPNRPTDYLLVITTTYIHPISYILHSYTHTHTRR